MAASVVLFVPPSGSLAWPVRLMPVSVVFLLVDNPL